MSIPGPDSLVVRTRFVSVAAACLAMAGAMAALVGWAFDLPLLKTSIAGSVAMNPATAVLFILLGLSLALLKEGNSSRVRGRIGISAAGMVALLGLVKISAYALGHTAGFDQLLFRDKLDGNEVAPNTAVFFLLTGLSLLLVDRRLKRGICPAQVLALLTALGCFVSVMGYVYGVRPLFGVASYIPMAANTAAIFLLLSLGILAARPSHGVMAVVTNPSIGGMATRRLLAAALVVPAVCGWLRLLGERDGLYGAEFGVALMVASSAVVFIIVAWWTGAVLARVDGRRREAEQALRTMNENLERLISQRTAELAESNRALQSKVEEHRRARRELAVANRELEQKNQENETFVYSVSHDLRSPLVNLQGFSNELREVCSQLRGLVADHALPAEVQRQALDLIDRDAGESIHFIQSAVTRLSNIIDALLRLSRAGRVEYQCREVEVEPIVERIVESMSGTIAQKGAEVTVKPLLSVWGDATAVEQIFANLIGNALNYLDPQRSGQIEIGWREEAADDSTHCFYVKDNGLGIPESQRAKAFQAFQRLHAHAAKGEGMGLAIVRRMVERFGGRIWIESCAQPGTTFCFTLPIPAREQELTSRIEEHESAIADCVAG